MPDLTCIIPAIFVLLWSTGFIGAKFGLPYMEPFFLLAVRYALVLALFGAAALVLRSRWLSWAETAGQLLVGALLHGAYLGGVFYAIAAGTPAGLTAIIVGLQPILTAGLGWLWLGQPVHRGQAAGLGLGFAGIVLVIAGANAPAGAEGIASAGLPAALLALLGISVGTVLQKRLGTAVPLLPGALAQYAGALLVTLPVSLAFETLQAEPALPLVLSMTWLVLGLSVLAIGLLMLMIRAGQVARVSSFFYLVPPLTVLQAWLFFGETLSPVSAFGGLAAAAGVYLVIRKPRTDAAAAAASAS